MEPILAGRDLRKSFGPTLVLEHADFRLHAGDTVALVGPNGAGKSTLFKLIAGETPLDLGDLIASRASGTGTSRRSRTSRRRRPSATSSPPRAPRPSRSRGAADTFSPLGAPFIRGRKFETAASSGWRTVRGTWPAPGRSS